MRSEIDLLGNDAQFMPDLIPVDVNGAPRYPDKFGDILGGFSLFDEIGDLYFPGGKSRVF